MLPTAAVVLAIATAPDPATQVAAIARQYQAFDLPLPPRDAKLYCFTLDYIAQPGDPPIPTGYKYGFGIATDKAGKPTTIVTGFDEDDWVPDFATKFEEIKRDGLPQPLPKLPADLPFIAQCELLGWHELALAALDKWTRQKVILPDTSTVLASLAWKYWEGQFRHSNADRALVARRMNALAAFFDHPPVDPFLGKLNQSLKPSGAKAGTPEAAIDELMDVAGYQYRLRRDKLDPRLEAVYRFGFDAIPALLAHLDDDRITRAHHHGVFVHFNFPCESYDYSVKHLVRDILFRYMGTVKAQHAAETTTTQKAEDVKAWWADVQKEGEEQYLIRRVLGTKAWETDAHDQLLAVILAKYPKRLPDVIAGLKKADPMWTPLDPFVDALLRSSIPADDQKKRLLDLLDSSDRDWQASALKGLHRLDPVGFQQRMIAILADLPAMEDTKYEKRPSPDRYACFAEVALGVDDAKVWAAVGKYLDRATAEVKLEWISYLYEVHKGDKCYLRVVACLAALLADKTFRVEKNGNSVNITEVRNFAAKQLGEILRVRGMPTDNAPADEWEKYREEVAKAAEKATKRKG